MSSNDDKFKAKTNDEKLVTEVQETMTRLEMTNDGSEATKKTSTSGAGGGKAVTWKNLSKTSVADERLSNLILLRVFDFIFITRISVQKIFNPFFIFNFRT